MKPQHRILQNVMDILIGDGVQPEQAVQIMLQWIAYRIGVDPGMLSPTLQLSSWEPMNQIDLTGLQEDPADHIGEFLHEFYPQVMTVASYVPHAACMRMAERQAKMIKPSVMNRVIDRCGGSGGMMVALWSAMDEKVIIYMAEPDVTSYHIALINAKLYGISSRVINADYRSHDMSADSLNWRYAGMWTPPHWKHLIQAKTGS